jgi:hypothetical protein
VTYGGSGVAAGVDGEVCRLGLECIRIFTDGRHAMVPTEREVVLTVGEDLAGGCEDDDGQDRSPS